MGVLREFLDERNGEVETYLDLIGLLEAQIQSGIPRIGGDTGASISTIQQRMLCSSAYLQLYNVVEATVTRCMGVLCDEIVNPQTWTPSDLTQELRREWVRFNAKTHSDLSYENRLTHTFELSEDLINSLPVQKLKIERGGGGNWDDETIYKLSQRVGLILTLSPDANRAAKATFRDDKGALKFVMKLRNDLAHGNISFAECGAGETVSDLRELKSRVFSYLEEVITKFEAFIEAREYLQPDKRTAQSVENAA
jgi:hypothetical protein